MLMIKFYSSFCSFHRLYILKIGIQLKHEEINWNSVLQNQKSEGRTKSKNKESAEISCPKLPMNLPATLFFLFCLSFFFFPNYPYVIVSCFCQFGNLYCFGGI